MKRYVFSPNSFCAHHLVLTIWDSFIEVLKVAMERWTRLSGLNIECGFSGALWWERMKDAMTR